MFAGNKMFTDYKNMSLYNGWIDPLLILTNYIWKDIMTLTKKNF